MHIIGLTGGIGSGKSTVAKLFRQLGVPVFFSDEAARKLQDENAEVKAAIAALFGRSVYDADGKLDRAKVAAIVFNDKKKLEELNAVVHPAVAKSFEDFCKMHSDSSYVIKEAAILFEIGAEKQLDKMIVVTAPEELRVARVTERDGVPREDVLKRIRNQWPEEEKTKRADFVIRNDEKELLLPQVIAIHEQLLKS